MLSLQLWIVLIGGPYFSAHDASVQKVPHPCYEEVITVPPVVRVHGDSCLFPEFGPDDGVLYRRDTSGRWVRGPKFFVPEVGFGSVALGDEIAAVTYRGFANGAPFQNTLYYSLFEGRLWQLIRAGTGLPPVGRVAAHGKRAVSSVDLLLQITNFEAGGFGVAEARFMEELGEVALSDNIAVVSHYETKVYEYIDGTWSLSATLPIAGKPAVTPGFVMVRPWDGEHVEVYGKSDLEWNFIQGIMSPEDVGDQFGESLAVDGSFAVIGAPSGTEGGSAYVFQLQDGMWIQTQKLVFSSTMPDDRFGGAVDISGDTIAVWAAGPLDIEGGIGFVTIFRRHGEGWVEEEILGKRSTPAYDFFGASVAIGSSGLFSNAPERPDREGVLVRYGRAGGRWIEEAAVLSEPSPFGNGGIAAWSGGVAAAADNLRIFDISNSEMVEAASFHDRLPIQVVAAAGETIAAGSGPFEVEGFVNVYERYGDLWSNTAHLVAGDVTAGSATGFGSSVSLNDNTLVVGAAWDEEAFSSTGAAYVYRRINSTWGFQQKLFPSSGVSQFGISVAVTGNFIVVGGANEGGSGILHIFDHLNENWETSSTIEFGEDGIIAGYSLAAYGDKIAVGIPGGIGRQGNRGRVEIFKRDADGWQRFATLAPPVGGADNDIASFGASVAIYNNIIVVGGPGADAPEVDSGAVYVINFGMSQAGADALIDLLDGQVSSLESDVNGDGIIDCADVVAGLI